jgi:hypothetical protein
VTPDAGGQREPRPPKTEEAEGHGAYLRDTAHSEQARPGPQQATQNAGTHCGKDSPPPVFRNRGAGVAPTAQARRAGMSQTTARGGRAGMSQTTARGGRAGMSQTTAPGRGAGPPPTAPGRGAGPPPTGRWMDSAHREEQARKKHLRTANIGSWLIALACRQHPADNRADLAREYTNEFRCILADPGTPRSLRAARALLYAADHLRGAWRTRHRHPSRDRTASRGAFLALASTAVVLVTGALRHARKKPGALRCLPEDLRQLTIIYRRMR